MGNFQGIPKKDFVESNEIQRAFSNYDIKIPSGESINELNSRLFSILDYYAKILPILKLLLLLTVFVLVVS